MKFIEKWLEKNEHDHLRLALEEAIQGDISVIRKDIEKLTGAILNMERIAIETSMRDGDH